ncbi:MAG: hypothetical protein WC658_00085 [Candidatus Omnitrophota bacterium]
MDNNSRRVFVLGAGFSKCCDIPLGGKELFAKAFNSNVYPLDKGIRERYLPFFYPNFKPEWENFPDIE